MWWWEGRRCFGGSRRCGGGRVEGVVVVGVEDVVVVGG